jgi:homoserine kinase type II
VDLPMGIIHGDLFHDNALFNNDQLTAVLDIYNAATAYLLFDLAIVANDWCIDADLQIDTERERALLQAYAEVRPFTEAEREVWALLTRTAAMRFWLSRLEPWVGAQHGKGSGKTLLNPDEYKQILLARIANPSQLP